MAKVQIALKTSPENETFLVEDVLVSALPLVATLELDAVPNHEISDDNRVTEHPIETGATVNDHINPKPTTLRLQGIVSEINLPSDLASKAAFGAALAASFVDSEGTTTEVLSQAAAALTVGNSIAQAFNDYGRADSVYQLLLDARNAGLICDIYTGPRDFLNYAITRIGVTRTAQDGAILNFDLGFKELRFIEVTETAKPLNTTRGRVENAGPKLKNANVGSLGEGRSAIAALVDLLSGFVAGGN